MKRICTLLLLLGAITSFAQNSLTVEAPRVVAADETFRIVFTADGKMSDFNWPGSQDFTIIWGPQSGSMSSTSIINGKRTSSYQATVTYVMQARGTGKFTLPAATAEVDHNSCSSHQFTIEVVEGESTPDAQAPAQSRQSRQQQPDNQASAAAPSGTVSSGDIFLRLYLGKTNLVKGEPTTATLKLYTRADIAGFEDVHFPTFDGFWSKEIESPQNIEFSRENVNGTIYNSALLRRYMLIPQQSGTLKIDPAEMVCQVRILTSAAPRSIFDSFFDSYETVRKRLTTSPITVKVNSLPAGAPASFAGGVGNYTLDVKLSQDNLKSHEAASLIVKVSGKGNISMLEPPVINLPPDFELYDTKVSDNFSYDGTSGTRTFELPFIPRSHGSFDIEPVEYSYYDISKGKYVTLRSQPIHLDIAKGEDIDGGGVVMPGVNRQDVKNISEDIRFIHKDIPSFRKEGVFFAGSPLFWGLLALIVALFFILSLALRSVIARRSDVVGNRNRRANKMARARLKQAGDYLSRNLPTAYYEELHKAVLGYVSDKLAIPASDLSKDNISEKLAERGVDELLNSRLTAILDACEFARYAPDAGHTAMENLYNEAINVISEIDGKVKKNCSKAAGMAVVSLLILCTSALGASAASVSEVWKSAADSYVSGDYAAALRSYKALEQQGLVSPELYYNTANAHYKLGENARAILYYKKCLKLDPSHKDAANNLEMAQQMSMDKIDVIPDFILVTWARRIKYLASPDGWAVLTLVFALLTVALLLTFKFASSEKLRKTAFISACVAFVLAVAGLAFSLSERKDARACNEAVIIQPVSSVKSSPGDAGKSLFVLHEGTVVSLLDELGSWTQIELSDGRQGWVETSEIGKI